MRKAIIWLGSLFILFILWTAISGWDYDQTRVIPGKVNAVVSLDTEYGKAVLFEDEFHGSFGVARIDRKWGFLYRYGGGSTGYVVEEGKPFQAAGDGTDKPDGFVVGVKTAEGSDIKYIAIGGHLEGASWSEPYSLTLEEVRSSGDTYRVQEVKDGYALFVFDEYTEDSWTIRAFDASGRLIADKWFGGDERYIDWEM